MLFALKSKAGILGEKFTCTLCAHALRKGELLKLLVQKKWTIACYYIQRKL
jgi:hypothetical protein